MTSGVYILDFGTGQYLYIGKADDIERRWEQHRKDFEKGTHTKKMQWAYNTFGPPSYEVAHYIHSDHIDLVESMLIEQNWGPKLLNGNRPKQVPPHERDVLVDYMDELVSSTADHLKAFFMLVKQKQDVESKLEGAEARINELNDDGIVLPHEVAEQLTELQGALKEKNKELERLSKLSWFDRLFNFKVLC